MRRYSDAEAEALKLSKSTAFRHLYILFEIKQSAEALRITAPAELVASWEQLANELAPAIETCQKIIGVKVEE